jgi:hypothetical protein
MEKCLQLIEKKLQWGSRFNWSHYNFEVLSDRINEETGILISTRTLLRLFKMPDLKNYNPQIATKNGLTKFLGYKNWIDFTEQKSDSQIESTTQADSAPSKKPGTLIKIIVLALIVIITIGVYFLIQAVHKESVPDITFTCDSVCGKAPFTTSFQYKIPIRSKRNYFFNSGEGLNKHSVTPYKASFNHCYLTPGVFDSKIMNSKGDTLKSIRIIVESANWESVIGYDDTKAKPIPFTNKPLTSRKGIFHVPLQEVVFRKVDTSRIYWVNYLLIKKMEASGDHFTLTTRFKNNTALDGISCFDMMGFVHGEKSSHRVHFTQKGCSYYVNNQFSERKTDGKNNDLSKFGINIEDWNILELETKEKNIKVTINGMEIFITYYRQSIGTIRGISFMFKGGGALDYVKLVNQEGQVVLDEGF